MLFQQIWLTLALIVRGSDSYHVLLHHNWGTKSHLIQMAPLAEGLLDRGHHVTAVIFSTFKIQHENYTEILVPNGVESWTDKVGKIAMDKEGGQSEWSVKLNFWMSLINMRGELYDGVGLRPMRDEQGGWFNRMRTEIAPYFASLHVFTV